MVWTAYLPIRGICIFLPFICPLITASKKFLRHCLGIQSFSPSVLQEAYIIHFTTKTGRRSEEFLSTCEHRITQKCENDVCAYDKFVSRMALYATHTHTFRHGYGYQSLHFEVIIRIQNMFFLYFLNVYCDDISIPSYFSFSEFTFFKFQLYHSRDCMSMCIGYQ